MAWFVKWKANGMVPQKLFGGNGWINKQDDLGNFFVPIVFIKPNSVKRWIKDKASKLDRKNGTLIIVVRCLTELDAEIGICWTKNSLELIEKANYDTPYYKHVNNLKVIPKEV